MQRSFASACLFAWLWSTAAVAAPDGGLPGLDDEPAAPGAEAPAEPTAPAEPEAPTNELADAPAEPESPAEPSPTEEPAAPTDELAETPAEPKTTTEPAPTDELAQTPPAEPPPAAGGTPATATPPPAPTSSPAATSSPPPSSSPPPASKTPPASQPPPSERDTKPARAAKDEGDDEAEGEEEEEEEEKEKIKHRGFIIDFRAGVMGCTGDICSRHGARPGFRMDGILGRNLLGFLDVALAGGWGRMGTRVAPGTEGLALYGLNLDALPDEAMLEGAVLPDFSQFTVNDARLESIQAGLDARLHVIPRGRFDPYVGVGLQYSQFRGVYDTPGGEVRMAFHGLAFPLQGGFVVFATKRLAFGAQFDYLVSWYGGMTVRGALGEDFGAPLAVIDEAATQAGSASLSGDLPHLWSAGGVIHIRLGK